MHALRHLCVAFTLLAVLSAAGAFASPARGFAFDYVDNGGFELGTERWTLVSSGSTFDADPDELAPYSGAGRARMVLDQPMFTLAQTSLAGVPAGDYDFSVHIRSDSSALVMYAQVAGSSPGAVYWKEESGNVAGEWWAFSGTVHVTGFNTISIRIGGSGATGDVIYVDEVRFEGAPPATMTPTDTPIPPTATGTPIPPTPTKTPKATSTPAGDDATSTPAEPGATAIGEGALLNGGFEDVAGDGSPAAWSKYGGTLAADGGDVRSGARAARLASSTESTKWLYQTVRVSGGTAYEFGSWLRAGPGVNGAWLRVSWYASGDGSGEALDATDSVAWLDLRLGEWQWLTTGSVLAPIEASSAKLRVMLQPGSDAFAELTVDDATFGPAATPPEAADGEPEPDPLVTAGRDTGVTVAPAGSGSAQRRAQADSPRTLDSTVVINEVLYDSTKGEDGADAEWVELYNAGAGPVSLEGWFLADGSGADELGQVVIPPHGFALVTGSRELSRTLAEASAPVVVVEGHIGNSLGNEGDTLLLIAPGGWFVDAISWGGDHGAMDPPIDDVPAGHSIERRVPGVDTDRARDLVDNERPSPGAPYAARLAQPAVATGSSLQVLEGGGVPQLDWVVWLLAAVSLGTLAGVGSLRVWPMVAGRLRHQ